MNHLLHYALYIADIYQLRKIFWNVVMDFITRASLLSKEKSQSLNYFAFDMCALPVSLELRSCLFGADS